VSLILDALRKLEREKNRPDPAVVVVGSVPWPGAGRARRLWIAVGLLGVIVTLGIVFAWRARVAGPPTAPVVPVPAPTAPAPTGSSAAPPPAAAEPSSLSRLPDVAPPPVEPHALPAPTPATGRARPAARPPVDLQLMAISERDGHPIAIISDHLVREGDRFDDVRILRISPTEVEVEEHGRRRVLRF